jgi:type VI secretion system secreted protein Hcp
MALTGYLTLKKGGAAVEGSSRFKNREGQILVVGMSHEVTSERSTAGHPTGARKHRSLVVQKDIDRSSPILWQAFADNVEFDFCFLEFTRFPPGGGQQEIHASINLKGARIVAIQSVMPNARVADNAAIPEYESIHFAYEMISWNWLGKDVDDSDAQFLENDCDFSRCEPTWIEALETRMQKVLQERAAAGGKVAVDALKAAFESALAEQPK